MAEPFDVFRYIGYLRLRLRWIAAVCGLALLATLAISLWMTRQYTATARIVIEPPAGADLRSAMAVSPIYLESLKTYEHYAESDSLFQNALDRFGLRRALSGRTIESLKRKMLKAGIVRNTRILEIAVTFPDPEKAHAIAIYIADATIKLAASAVDESNRDLVRGAEQQAIDVRARLQETEDAWSKLLSAEPIEELQSAMEAAGSLRGKLEEYIANADLEIADGAERLKQAKPADQSEIRLQTENARARAAELRKQMAEVSRRNVERERLLAIRSAHRDKLESERKAWLAELAAAETRLREARGEAGYRGERLKIIDPGIVPESPSSPNIPLNLAGALVASLALSILYITFEMNWRERRAGSQRAMFQIRQARDD